MDVHHNGVAINGWVWQIRIIGRVIGYQEWQKKYK